ncbi:putative Rho-GTPase-activating protein [Triangularia verruculosa]|uniref:Rho-GTPase-activating protein n=1 Tax=Triangularia verruculosa TaxID=2587418 RepID=A0AAN6XB72_9PEZI|nr:putative Rho-GTPase-activating protein [Triangularia verruculosa]
MSLGGDTAVTAPEQGATSPISAPQTQSDELSPQVQDVLSSEIGISVMLNRLKQSIASAKEFSNFLKKRSALEDEHANALKKLCRLSQDSMARSEPRGGSFARAYEEMMNVHERMADNGIQFAMSLHQMSEDLQELAAVAEKSRKGWKQNGLSAEHRVVELETAMRKSKAKYDSLAEEYDRARTGDTTGRQGGKVFGFKSHKSGAQHEEDLLRKAQAADQDYQTKVQVAATERSELLSRTRPETVKALHDIVRECDSGLVLQMQKFASFNEKLVLSNGLSISPLKTGSEARSLRESILSIDNDKDLNDYLASHHGKVPPKAALPQYERNHLIDASSRAPVTTYTQPQQQSQVPSATQPPPSQVGMFQNTRSSTFSETVANVQSQGPYGHNYGQSTSSVPILGNPGGPSSQPQHERSFSHGSALGPSPGNVAQQQYGARGSTPQQSQPPPGSRFNGAYNSPSSRDGPPQLGALPFQSTQPQQPQQPNFNQLPSQQGGSGPVSNPLQQHPTAPPQAHRNSPPIAPQMAPSRPVFSVSLTRLYERDGLAVPMVVYQCIQAVDLFGLNVEGIYRLSGSVPAVNKLKTLFDTDSSSNNLDFRNPENFFHDVNSVAGLLKQFFRDLPDPLLTREHYSACIDAARNEDDIVRRDSLHAIINNLPDPNYATLRALTLHLHRVIENSGANRMSSQNLAIVFGPTLMGTSPGSAIADAGWQVRVIDTILQNTFQIFDEDD